jgi:hypothetical protein
MGRSQINVVCIVKANVKGRDTYNLMTSNVDGVWNVRGWKNVEDALEHWEGAYRRAHNRGHIGSMTACLHFIMFHPSVVELTLEEITPLIPKERRVVSLSTDTGSIDAVILNDKAAAFWEKGSKPALIEER